jgi:hypothetical protein
MGRCGIQWVALAITYILIVCPALDAFRISLAPRHCPTAPVQTVREVRVEVYNGHEHQFEVERTPKEGDEVFLLCQCGARSTAKESAVLSSEQRSIPVACLPASSAGLNMPFLSLCPERILVPGWASVEGDLPPPTPPPPSFI